MVKKFYFALFLLFGFYINLIQSIFFKEFVFTYYGNELLLGTILFIFFISFAAGSYLYQNFIKYLKNNFFIYMILTVSLGLLAIKNIEIIRNLRGIADLNPNALFNLKSIIYYTFLIVFPTALFTGFLFPYSAALIEKYKKEKSLLSVFSFWTAGFFLCGVLFSFVFYKYFNPIELILSVILTAAVLLFL